VAQVRKFSWCLPLPTHNRAHSPGFGIALVVRRESVPIGLSSCPYLVVSQESADETYSERKWSKLRLRSGIQTLPQCFQIYEDSIMLSRLPYGCVGKAGAAEEGVMDLPILIGIGHNERALGDQIADYLAI
jgi:hypothetical protein